MADLVRTILILNYGGFPHGITPFQFRIQVNLRKILTHFYLRYYKKSLPFLPNILKEWLLPVSAARLAEELPITEKEQLLSIVRFEIKKLQEKHYH
jgi:hypothetical protein